MAVTPFTLLNPEWADGNLSNVLISDIKSPHKIPLTFSRQNSNKFIFCNYLETFPAGSVAFLGDPAPNGGNRFLNQDTNVGPGTTLVYASYQNKSGTAFTFGIHIYNPTASTATITRRNYGFSSGSGVWDTMPGDVWVDYFNNPGGNTYSIASNGNLWIMEKAVGGNHIFNALQKFESNASRLIVTVYAYVKASLTGTATAYPAPTPGTLEDEFTSGYGISPFGDTLTTNVTILASALNSMTNADANLTKSKWHSIFNKSSGNTNEIVSLYSVNKGKNSLDTTLGNYGIQYNFNVKLKNDTATARTFRGFAGANPMSNCMAIRTGTTIKYKFMRNTNDPI